MPNRNLVAIFSINTFLPNELRHKIFFPKYLIHQQPEVVHLIIVNADKDNSIFPQEALCQIEAWHHHIEPVAVVLAVFAAVLVKHFLAGHITLLVFVTHTFQIFFFSLGKLVGIDKRVVARIVWWINVNHFYLAEVTLLKHLQHLHVFTLDENVLCGVEINGLSSRWNECS